MKNYNGNIMLFHFVIQAMVSGWITIMQLHDARMRTALLNSEQWLAESTRRSLLAKR